ncbi:MAG: GNAT family N-acetyltransferase [Candidatus Limnocylindrales bacterium]
MPVTPGIDPRRPNTLRLSVEDPGSADAQWCVQQYFNELNARFQAGFDPSLSISADIAELTPPAGLFLVARVEGRPVGCGALKFHPGAPAELKRMWVAPGARGMGLGRRLLAELEREARSGGVEALHLETNASLTEAIALYRNSGFVEVPPSMTSRMPTTGSRSGSSSRGSPTDRQPRTMARARRHHRRQAIESHRDEFQRSE